MSSYTNDGGTSAAQNTNAMDPVGMNSEKAEAARQKSAEVMAALKEGKPGEADEIMGKPDDSKGPSVIDRVKRKIGVGGDKKEEGDVPTEDIGESGGLSGIAGRISGVFGQHSRQGRQMRQPGAKQRTANTGLGASSVPRVMHIASPVS
ncbi:hypothetical protein LTR48_000439 [Friedmanniomyces endolithicus]|uniref:Conidiation-specific protein 6 n=1 Tax=Rachicladosporium monterosium TaxID=1507873 RepID=A0ABR0LHN7_9PEZI|nr:hypothetical protein LTR29_000458 [Friedmanniomyces endolithicus]KAK1089575.1 hypothetical protein LTR48_000439 [Friedmanniomyces endolithicus]KAK1811508.1 hypothetical protein LTR12_014106 [Friedmanniomyces endolithicus]KAK5148406.1 hypothetical protein LTR32_000299 [Rachicladosporium monterosium]